MSYREELMEKLLYVDAHDSRLVPLPKKVATRFVRSLVGYDIRTKYFELEAIEDEGSYDWEKPYLWRFMIDEKSEDKICKFLHFGSKKKNICIQGLIINSQCFSNRLRYVQFQKYVHINGEQYIKVMNMFQYDIFFEISDIQDMFN